MIGKTVSPSRFSAWPIMNEARCSFMPQLSSMSRARRTEDAQ